MEDLSKTPPIGTSDSNMAAATGLQTMWWAAFRPPTSRDNLGVGGHQFDLDFDQLMVRVGEIARPDAEANDHYEWIFGSTQIQAGMSDDTIGELIDREIDW